MPGLLIARDNKITQYVFFERSRSVIFSVLEKVLDYKADYDELVNELYMHLMEDNARRLRSYGGQASFYSWLATVARNYFLEKKHREAVIENEHDDRLLTEAGKIIDDNPVHPDKKQEEEDMRVRAILDQIDNERYRFVIEQRILEGKDYDELERITGIKKANLYNIYKRALKKLEQIKRIAHAQSDSLCAVRCEQYILHCFGIRQVSHPGLRQGLASFRPFPDASGGRYPECPHCRISRTGTGRMGSHHQKERRAFTYGKSSG